MIEAAVILSKPGWADVVVCARFCAKESKVLSCRPGRAFGRHRGGMGTIGERRNASRGALVGAREEIVQKRNKIQVG